MMLVRRRRLDLHRRLGLAMAWLIPVMVVVALATAWTVQRQAAALPGSHDPQFLSINLTDMLGFATLAGAAIASAPRSLGAQKADAAFPLLSQHRRVRAAVAAHHRAGGDGHFWGFFIAYNLGGDIPIVLLGAYDLATRGRLHPAYVAGAGWVLANELAAAWLYFSPGWKAISLRLLGLT